MQPVKVKRLPGNEDLPLPQKMTPGSSGFDLAAAVPEDWVLSPGERLLVPTGLAVELPAGCEAQIRPRSGLAYKYGVTVLNAPGTVDADYRGEIKVLLFNAGREEYIIRRGDRIAQMVIVALPEVYIEEVEELKETERGAGGFGHTGS